MFLWMNSLKRTDLSDEDVEEEEALEGLVAEEVVGDKLLVSRCLREEIEAVEEMLEEAEG